jgi:hypothetical protein
MQAFGVILAVLLGTSLKLHKTYKKDVIDSYHVIQPKLQALAELYPQEAIYAQVIRWLQLRVQEYWTEVEVALGHVSPPNFKMLFEAIQYKQWLQPEIPITSLHKLKRTCLQTTGGDNSTSGSALTQTMEGAPAASTPMQGTRVRVPTCLKRLHTLAGLTCS